ncbi:Putative uncharacterized transposon-derived protein [Frankliniella fusca]|uniref:Uncharacterized transposon-derived protein n=1 Tax=Frankliniella fusca TaxID=407009 RepID=A0AAE1LQB9_9NEOP|nr:Putative uncharacterized transposon-derived protein [Frankliniella fusca]
MEGPSDGEIKKTWSDVNSPAAFAGKKYVIDRLREKYRNVRYSDLAASVGRVLSEEPGYTIHYPRRRRFLTRFYNIASYYRLLEVDLADVQGLARYNSGVKYWIVAVEAASRRIFLETMRDKSGPEVVRGMTSLFEKMPQKVSIVRSDRGSEFKSKAYLRLLRENGMTAQYASGESKASLAEKAIGKVFNRVFRFLTYGNTSTYLPVLSKIVAGLNATVHSHTGVAADDFDPEKHLYPTWEKTVLKHRPSFAKQRKKKYKFNIGDRVRVSLSYDPMSKGYAGYYSRAYYFVTSRAPGPPHTYRIKNIENEEVQGEFYQEELQLVNDREDQSYPVDAVHARRTVRGEREVLVSFKGWPKNHRVWVPAAAVRDTVS